MTRYIAYTFLFFTPAFCVSAFSPKSRTIMSSTTSSVDLLDSPASSSAIKPTTTTIREFSEQKVKVVRSYEYDMPLQYDNFRSHCVILFTGGNALIPADVYSDFTTELAQKNMTVYIPTNSFNAYEKLFETLANEHVSVSILTHSSSAIKGITLGEVHKISNVYCLDPVDSRVIEMAELKPNIEFRPSHLLPWNDKNPFDIKFLKKYPLNSIKNLVFIRAQKSYEWNLNPFAFQIPFIPVFAMNEFDFEMGDSVQFHEDTVTDFGHCDILNYPYANMMHESKISIGNAKRDVHTMKRYHQWIGDVIQKYLDSV